MVDYVDDGITFNISALYYISLTEKANTTEQHSNPPPTRAGVVSGIEVKVGFSPLGGTAVVLHDFIYLRLW